MVQDPLSGRPSCLSGQPQTDRWSQDSAVPGRLVNGSEAQDSIFTACSRAGIALFSATEQDPKHSRLQQIGTEGPHLRE